jgi:GNAT superfamily N-acetyltransferase
VHIRPARPDEGERLREIAAASKAYWGYDPAWIAEWIAGGDFSPEAIAAKDVYVAEADDRAIAYAVVLNRGEKAVLDDLWVEPEWIGKCVGRRLFTKAVDRARELGAKRLEWEAERHALGFYEKMGGRKIGETAPNRWGRVSAVMAVEL